MRWVCSRGGVVPREGMGSMCARWPLAQVSRLRRTEGAVVIIRGMARTEKEAMGGDGATTTL